jgi:hypothetical protein
MFEEVGTSPVVSNSHGRPPAMLKLSKRIRPFRTMSCAIDVVNDSFGSILRGRNQLADV